MELRPIPNGSNISAAGYDAETQTLRVMFQTGAVYEFSDVPESLGNGIFDAESPGKFFAGAIRPSFKGVPVVED